MGALLAALTAIALVRALAPASTPLVARAFEIQPTIFAVMALAEPKPPSAAGSPGTAAPQDDDGAPYALDPDLDRSSTIEGGSRRALAEAGEERVKDLVSQYRDRASYPPWSYVIPAGRDPVAESARAPETSAALRGGERLSVSLSAWSLTPDETLTVTAALHDSQDRVAKAKSGRASLVNTAVTGYLAHIALTAGKGGVLTGTWKVPPADTAAGDPGVHRLQVVVTTETGESFEAQTEVLISVPGVRLTGRYRDRVQDGNLVVEVEIAAKKKTRAHLSATLAPVSAPGGQRAFAQKAAVVEAGTAFVDLVFYGRTLHALGAPGPYRVMSLVVQDTSSFPPARLPLEVEPYTTAIYSLSAFNNEPFGQKDLLELADFLENR